MKFKLALFVIINFIIYTALHNYGKSTYITRITEHHANNNHFKGYDKYLNLNLPSKLKKEIGFTFTNTENSYDKYLFRKKEKTRVGILGNSLSWGSEINPNLSYTNLLNQLDLNYEFISLAAPSFGFFRSERLLKFYKQQLNLDKIILGPFLLEPNKDLTFDMMFGSLAAGFSHGRYIFDNKLRFISLNSANSSDRFENLANKIKLFPNLSEIRHDYHGPYNFHIISKLFNKNYINPFYDYREKDVFDEYKKISKKLLEELSENYEIISLDLTDNINQNLSSSFPKLTNIIRLDIPQKIPYWKLRHPSELGHQRIKELIEAYFNKKETLFPPLKVCTRNLNFSRFQSPIGLEVLGKNIAHLNTELKVTPQDTMVILTENNDFINSSIILLKEETSKVELFIDNKKYQNAKRLARNVYQINFSFSKLVKGVFPINRYFYIKDASDIKVKSNDVIVYHAHNGKLNSIKNLNFYKLNKTDQITNNMAYRLHLPNKLTISGNFKYECN